MRTLILPLKAKYFDQIRAGVKLEEYREAKPYWIRRLEHQHYDRLILTKGYPAKSDASRRIEMPWRGCELKTITHPLFGDAPVTVFAIDVRHSRQDEFADG